MHNRLIFRYHRVRAQPKLEVLTGCWCPVRDAGEGTNSGAGSEAGTQEGR